MTLYKVLPLIQGIFSSILFILVAKQDWRKPASRLFLFFLASLAFWGFIVTAMRFSTSLHKALLWERAILIMISLTISSFYLFVTEYTGSGSRPIKRLAILFIAVTTIIAPTDLLVQGMSTDRYGNVPIWGPLFILWIPISYALAISAAVYLGRAWRASSSYEERNRYLYFILGAVCSVLGSGFDALSGAGVPIYPMAIPANILFACITTIAIVKYHLMDIRLTLRQGVIYLFTSLISAAPLVLAMLIWLWMTNGHDISNWWLVPLICSAALFIGPLWAVSRDFLKRLFYGERYDYLMALERLDEQSKGINDMNKICSLIVGLADKTMQPGHVCILIATEHDNYRVVASLHTDNIESPDLKIDTLVSWLRRTEAPMWHQDIDSIPLLQAMSSQERLALNSLGAELYSLIASKSQPIGIIALGPKQRGQLYTREDLRLLQALSRQAALNLENVRLLELEREQVVRLQQIEKMKTEFLFIISHQLRTPLTPLKVASELLADTNEQISEDSRRKLMSTIKNSTRDLEAYITTILDFARIESGNVTLKQEITDIKEIIQEVAGALASQIKLKEQSLDLILADPVGITNIDRGRIKQVLTILMENAVKFTPRKGHISVKYQRSDTNLNVEVKDNGPGISQEEQQKIFNAYYQAQSRRPRDADGLGIGLAVAKKIVELHGGQIWVISRPGEGTAFIFTLPTRVSSEVLGEVEVD